MENLECIKIQNRVHEKSDRTPEQWFLDFMVGTMATENNVPVNLESGKNRFLAQLKKVELE